LVLGIVEGLTEFLPISSTGHLILAAKLLGLAQTDFQKSFEIVIQLGAIGAVVVLYWRQFLRPEVLTRVVVAFLPTGAIGLVLYPLVKSYLLGNESVVLLALFLGA
jgi:undecaprenyl-diphosphatase